MARIFTDGMELGTLSGFSGIMGSATAYSSIKRSGSYSLRCDGSGSYTWVDVGALNEIYIRAAYREYDYRSGVRLYVANDVDTPLIEIRRDTLGEPLNVYVGGIKVSDTGSFIPKLDTWYPLELHAKMDDVAGLIEVRINGILVVSYSGDTKSGGDTTFSRVFFRNRATFYVYYDDIAINDISGTEDNSWPGNGHIIALKPNAVGDSSQLSGSDGDSVDNHLLVDDVPDNGDTDYVYDTTVDNQDLYNLEALPTLPDNVVIRRVWPEAIAKDDGLGQIALPIKAGTTQDDGAIKDLSFDYSVVKGDEHTVNPDDLAPWEVSDIDALQIGVKIK